MSVGPPNIVGTATLPVVGPINPGARMGPFVHGSDLWIIAASSNGAGFAHSITAYKSTDSGANYTAQVFGPTVSPSTGPNFENILPSMVFPSYVSGATIPIGYQDVSGMLSTITFDMAAETFGTVNPSGITIPIFSCGNLIQVVRPGGQIVLVYNQFNLQIFAIQFNGSWGSPVEIDDGSLASWFLRNAVLDGAGNVGIWYGAGGGLSGPTGNILYAIFDGTSVTARIDTGFVTALTSRITQAPVYDSASDSIVLPLLVFSLSSIPMVSLLVGTPSAAPTFTMVTVATYTLFEQVDYVGVVGNAAGNQFNCFFRVRPTSTGYNWCVGQCSASALSGPWSTPTIYYNQNTDPPSPSVGFLGLGPVWVNLLTGGAIGVIVGLVIPAPTLQRATPYTWAVAGPPPPPGTSLQLIKTVTPGGTAVPSDFTLSYAGPVSGSGPGGVGPVAVPAGAYTLTETGPGTYDAGPWVSSGAGTLVGNVLTLASGQAGIVSINNAPHGTPPGPLTFAIISGALPPGLSLNTTTGVISGIPTAIGVYTYTAQVTDSNGNTATATCAITIGQSAEFELRRIYATMKPHPRMPVRGS